MSDKELTQTQRTMAAIREEWEAPLKQRIDELYAENKGLALRLEETLEDKMHMMGELTDAGDKIIALERRLEEIAKTAGGDWRMNSEFSMERIYATATGQKMPLPHKDCPDCQGGKYRERGRGGIVIPCQTCGGSGRVVERQTSNPPDIWTGNETVCGRCGQTVFAGHQCFIECAAQDGNLKCERVKGHEGDHEHGYHHWSE